MTKSSKKHPKKDVKMEKKTITNQGGKREVRTTTKVGSGHVAAGAGGTANQQDNIQTN